MKALPFIGLAVVGLSGCASSKGSKTEADPHSTADVRELQRMIEDQNKTIASLESVLRQQEQLTRMTPQQERSSEGAVGEPHVSSSPPSARGGLPWHRAEAWRRLKDGMSERQVLSILGNPTSTKDLHPFRTLFYRGEVTGSGFVSGNVQLQEDRVWQVNVPVF